MDEFTGTFDDIQEALEAQMRHKGDHVDKALTRLKELREAVPDRMQAIAEIIAIEGIDEFNNRCPDDYGTVVDKAAALLASADRSK